MNAANPDFDVLPADSLLEPARLKRIRELLGPVVVVVTKLADEAIARPLRSLDNADCPPAIGQATVVGVMCGIGSSNLVVAGFKTEEAMASFLASNAGLKLSPVTRWNGYLLVWFRTDFLASIQILDEMLWIPGGVVPLAWTHGPDEAVEVVLVQSGVPQLIRFNDINWPEPVAGVFRFEYLRSIYGQPYLASKRKRTLNLSFWSGWLIDRLGLVFDTRVDAFRRLREPDSKSETLGMGAATELVTGALQQSAQADQRNFPVAEIRPRRIQELLRLMQTMAAIRPASEVEGV